MGAAASGRGEVHTVHSTRSNSGNAQNVQFSTVGCAVYIH